MRIHAGAIAASRARYSSWATGFRRPASEVFCAATGCRRLLAARDPSWSQFLKTHAGAIVACDFLTVDTVLLRTLYMLVFIEIHSRRILYANCSFHPISACVTQQARNLTWELSRLEVPVQLAIHDRDAKFVDDFDQVHRAEGAKVGLCSGAMRRPAARRTRSDTGSPGRPRSERSCRGGLLPSPREHRGRGHRCCSGAAISSRPGEPRSCFRWTLRLPSRQRLTTSESAAAPSGHSPAGPPASIKGRGPGFRRSQQSRRPPPTALRRSLPSE